MWKGLHARIDARTCAASLIEDHVTDFPWNRTFAAALVAPLAAVGAWIAVVLVGTLIPGSSYSIGLLLLVGIPPVGGISYAMTWIAGIPIHYLMYRAGRRGLGSYAMIAVPGGGLTEIGWCLAFDGLHDVSPGRAMIFIAFAMPVTIVFWYLFYLRRFRYE